MNNFQKKKLTILLYMLKYYTQIKDIKKRLKRKEKKE